MKTWLKWLLGILSIGAAVMASIKLSRTGLERIKAHEGLRLKPYLDEAGRPTIGYGHLIKDTEAYLRDPAGITRDKAHDLLVADIYDTERALNQLVTVPLTGNMYDALVSFVYNTGITNFKNSTLLAKLNDKDYEGAAQEFQRWKYVTDPVTKEKKVSNGLLARRLSEQSMFVS